jgi:hypothetical protein
MIGSIRQLLAMALLLSAASADAQEDDLAQKLIDAKFDVDIGMFFPDKKRSFRVNGVVGAENIDIDFDQELNFKSSEETFAAEIGWQFGERWQVEGQYFSVADSEALILTEDVQWEDIVYQAGSNVSVATSFKVVRLFFSRNFTTAPHHNLGFGIGVNQMQIRVAVAGQALTEDGSIEFLNEAVSTQAPMPDIGVWYNRRLSPRWVFSTRLDWLKASVDPYDGSLVNAAVALDFAFNEHVALAMNYNYYRLKVGIRDSGWRGEAQVRFHGPYVSIKAFW